MRGLPHRIMQFAASLPEATPLCPAALLHLGNRAAVDQALSRLARSGDLMWICQGIYMRPIETRFGLRAPRVGNALAALSALWGQTIVPCGGAVANCLGLTTQNPVRAVYLTSGPSRRLHFSAHSVELRHAPRWQLAAPHRKAGDVIRALAWLGPEEVEDNLEALLLTLSEEDWGELAAARAVTFESVARDPPILGRYRHHLRHPRLRARLGWPCRRRRASGHAQSGETLDAGHSCPVLRNGSGIEPARS